MILVGNESSPFFYYHFGFSFSFKIVACFREFFVAQHGTEAMICYFPSSSDLKPQGGGRKPKLAPARWNEVICQSWNTFFMIKNQCEKSQRILWF